MTVCQFDTLQSVKLPKASLYGGFGPFSRIIRFRKESRYFVHRGHRGRGTKKSFGVAAKERKRKGTPDFRDKHVKTGGLRVRLTQ